MMKSQKSWPLSCNEVTTATNNCRIRGNLRWLFLLNSSFENRNREKDMYGTMTHFTLLLLPSYLSACLLSFAFHELPLHGITVVTLTFHDRMLRRSDGCVLTKTIAAYHFKVPIKTLSDHASVTNKIHQEVTLLWYRVFFFSFIILDAQMNS